MAPQNESSTSAASADIVEKISKIELANRAYDPKFAPPFEHPELAPVFPTDTYSEIQVQPYEDRALKADPTFKNLLADATVKHLEPKVGTELSGIQLHELTDTQRDELALLVAQRGVVFLRDQDITIDQQLDLGRYYGPLHIHQTNGVPEGRPTVHVVHNSVEKSEAFLKNHRLNGYSTWHSDVSYELQVSRSLWWAPRCRSLMY
jgi:sulfonate dioxygenase